MAVSHHPIAPFLRGAVGLQELPDGLVIAERFFPEQLDYLSRVGRSHRAEAPAGVVLEFATTGSEVALDLRVTQGINTHHPLFAEVMGGGATGERPYGRPEEGIVDGIDLVVDGRLHATLPVSGGTMRVAFENPAHDELEVRIYLPSIMGVAFGNLRTNGTLKPLPQRGFLLALGDSITQGFVCGRPSLAYPAQVASTLGLDLINQAIAGHTFDEETLGGFSLWRADPPEVVLVAYGTNDWSRTRSSGTIERSAVAFVEHVHRMFPKVPTYVLSPIWRADEHEPMPCGRPLTWMHEMLCRVCSRHDNMHVVDGYHSIPKDPTLFADGYLHPGARCMGLVADAVLTAMCSDGVDLMVQRHVAKRIRVRAADEFVSREALIDRSTAVRDGSPETHPQFDRLVRTIWRLRQPDGCPWDRKQTHATLTRHMVEEAYEAADAMRHGDVAHMREELGDVLEQVILNAQVADDAREFSIDDVCRELNEKLVRRHPHVFGDDTGTRAQRLRQASSEEDVMRIWNEVKREERVASADESGLMDSVPVSLPAILQAQKISKRATDAGLAWDFATNALQGVATSEGSAGSDGSDEDGTRALGDLLFALVSDAQRRGIDAEEALAASNARFRQRWAAMESQADLEQLDEQALNELWEATGEA